MQKGAVGRSGTPWALTAGATHRWRFSRAGKDGLDYRAVKYTGAPPETVKRLKAALPQNCLNSRRNFALIRGFCKYEILD